MMTKLIAAVALIVAFFAGMAFALAAVPHPDRPMALSSESPLILNPVPIKDIDPGKCTGTTRLIEAEEGRPVVFETVVTCKR